MDLMSRLENTDDVLLHYYPLHSALMDWGKDLESHLSEWICSHKETYQKALLKSFEAGCDFCSTSTQAASPWRADVFGLRHKVHEHNYLSAKWAKEITPPGRYVAGFVSSTNPDFLQPVGNLTPEEVRNAYMEQISALLEGGADLIMIVGNHLDASVIAIQVAKELGGLPVVAQNVFYRGKKGYRTLMGYDPATASRLVQEAGADVVGASCGLMKRAEDASDARSYFQFATSLVEEIRSSSTAHVSIQPNAGLAQNIEGKTIYPATPEELAEAGPDWVRAGARIVGGCCGTNLEHYRKLKVAIDELKR